MAPRAGRREARAGIAMLERGKVRPAGHGPRPTRDRDGSSLHRPGRFAHPYYWAAFILVGDPG